MRPARSVSPKTQAQADEAAQLAVHILGQEGGARSQFKKAVKLGLTKVAVQFVPAKPPPEGMCWTRRPVFKLVSLPAFDKIVLLLVLSNSVLMGFDDPLCEAYRDSGVWFVKDSWKPLR